MEMTNFRVRLIHFIGTDKHWKTLYYARIKILSQIKEIPLDKSYGNNYLIEKRIYLFEEGLRI